MNIRTFTTILILATAVIFTGCSSENKQEKTGEISAGTVSPSKKTNLNISILLDLSDRISPEKYANPSMEFYKRDLGYIESIVKGFEKHLESKPIRQDDDQIQVYFEPEPLNPEINNLAKRLKLSFTRDNTSKNAIEKLSSQYISVSTEIYNLAIKDKKYVGSDIWGFFKNKVPDYCIKPKHRNILFILTDGYMFHQDSKFMEGSKSSFLTPKLVNALKLNTSNFKNLIKTNGYGYVKANDYLDNLEVFVLGINPAKGNPFEGDVIYEYWANWFKEMKVKNAVIKQTDLPSNIDNLIQNYITQ